MTDRVDAAVARLDRVLPLRRRQRTLTVAHRQAHRDLLCHFLHHGRPPTPDDLPTDSLAAMVDADLVVLSEDGAIHGAYPFTTEAREHRVHSGHGMVHAMCAIDALGVAAMFAIDTEVVSRCRLGGGPVRIFQRADGRARTHHGVEVHAAIDWRASSTGPCAMHLCRQMMFLREGAQAWQDADPANRDLFDLDQATAFAARLFLPLMKEDALP